MGTFLEGPEKFSHPESYSNISNLTIPELFYLHILNMNRGSHHIRSFGCFHFSVFRYRRTKNGFEGPKSFRGFRKTGPRSSGLETRVKAARMAKCGHALITSMRAFIKLSVKTWNEPITFILVTHSSILSLPLLPLQSSSSEGPSPLTSSPLCPTK